MHAPSHATSITGSSGDSLRTPSDPESWFGPSVSGASTADHGCTRPSESLSRVPGQRLPPSPISRQTQPMCQPGTELICGKM